MGLFGFGFVCFYRGFRVFLGLVCLFLGVLGFFGVRVCLVFVGDEWHLEVG